MGPKGTYTQTDELFLMRLDGQLKMSHPLIKLANTLNWSAVEKEFAGYFVSTRGRPALPPRLVAGLLHLQHAFSASDEMVVKGYKGAAIDGIQILRSGQRIQSKTLKKDD